MSGQSGTRGPSGGNWNVASRPDRRGGSGGGKFPGGSGDGGGGRGGQTCHICGKTGHMKRDCPKRNAGRVSGGGLSHRGGPPSTIPTPTATIPPVTEDLNADDNKEDMLVKRFEGVERTAKDKPYRPSYGTQGDSVKFRTNYFPVRLPDTLDLHRYTITIDAEYKEGRKLPEPRNKKLKQIIKIMLGDLQRSNPKLPIATDFKANLICAGAIPPSSWVKKIKYFHEGDHAAGPDSQTYTLRIEENFSSLTVALLNEFLAFTNPAAPFRDREPMLQALNIILSYHAKSTATITMIGGNKAYPSANNLNKETSPLTLGFEAFRGYFLSVRLASFRTLVNVNVCHGAFHEATGLSTLIDHWGANIKESEWDHIHWVRLEAFLKGLKVRTNYLKDEAGNQVTKVRPIKGLASERDGGGDGPPPHVEFFAGAPYQVWFYLDDGRDLKKQKYKLKDSKGDERKKYISVEEYFKTNYPISLDPDGRYPVVNLGSRKDPRYVPAEACTVEPGQPAKLNPSQTDKMIKFASRKPSLNAASITSSGLSVLGLSPVVPAMKQFGIEIDDKMVAVSGRMLLRPAVCYKGDVRATDAPGGWNLRGVKFIVPVPKAINHRLETWGFLKFDDPKDGKKNIYDSATSAVMGTFRDCGIEMYDPFQASVQFDWRRGDYFGSKQQTVEDVIQAMARRPGMNILLIVLPSKDTSLYNRIKKFCDLTEGIHTVCVVEDRLFKNDSTIRANLALKFNLKLGGTNHTLSDSNMGIISKGKTMVVGIDVVHPSPGSGKASVASMVASIDKDLAQWPVDLRVQVREGQEMLDKIGPMLESRLALWRRHCNVYPENILVYRDGVSEGQEQQVLDEELKEMQKVGKVLYDEVGQRWPRFTLIVVRKRHHTRFFPPENHPQCDRNGNPKRGLVVDRCVTEPRNWDFFLQSHDAVQGTARPAHYCVLWDEIFTNRELEPIHEAIEAGLLPTDRLEKLSHSLCYLFSRAAKAVSIPAPVYYADIACTRAGRYLADVPSSSESATTDSSKMTAEQRERHCADLEKKIKVHGNLKDSMFYV